MHFAQSHMMKKGQQALDSVCTGLASPKSNTTRHKVARLHHESDTLRESFPYRVGKVRNRVLQSRPVHRAERGRDSFNSDWIDVSSKRRKSQLMGLADSCSRTHKRVEDRYPEKA